MPADEIPHRADAPDPPPVSAPRGPAWLRPALLGLALLAGVAAAAALGLGELLADLRGWILGLGALGPLVFVLLYALATTLAVPASPLTVAAGALFGSLVGGAVVAAGATLGAAGGFALARWFARAAVERWLGANPTFRRLDRLTERHGAIVVALTRLVPIFPFNLLNYGFGLTRVRFSTYLVWSFLCMLPGTLLFVVGADALARGLAEGRVPWLLVGVLVGVLALVSLLAHRARLALAAREAAAGERDAEP